MVTGKNKKQFEEWSDELENELEVIQNEADLNNIGYNEEQLEIRTKFIKLVKSKVENLIKEEYKEAYKEAFKQADKLMNK